MFYEKPQIWSECPLNNRETKKTNGAWFSARMSENQSKQSVVFQNRGCLAETVEPALMYERENRFKWLRKNLKFC